MTQPDPNALALTGTSSTGLVLSNDAMQMAFRMAELMAEGKATVPKHLQGSPSDCMAVTLQALQWNMSPFAVAQKTHLVNGTLGYEAQLVNAVLQSTGAIDSEFEYEFKGAGEDIECRVGAIPRGKKTITWGEWLSARSVTTKNSPLWKTNPKQQLGYLQVKNWARLYKPGAILGVYTPDELAQPGEKFMGNADVVPPPPPPPPSAYDQAKFDANLKKWSETIVSGRKTAQYFIDFAQARGEPFTEEQKAKLLSIKVNKAAAATDVTPKGEEAAAPLAKATADTPDAAALTYAQIADRIVKAGTLDDLDGLDEHIGAIPADDLRGELVAKLEARREQLPF